MRKGVRMDYTLTIEDVLRIVKNADYKNIQIVRRFKNELFMAKRKICELDIIQAVKELEVTDLIAGPIEDDDANRKHPVWIFKKKAFKVMCYIKLKVINKNRTVIVISFHEDERREA